MRILLVEDEKRLTQALEHISKKENMRKQKSWDF